jgi:hypothetical protein
MTNGASPNALSANQSQKIRWMGHTARVEKAGNILYKISSGKPKPKLVTDLLKKP